MSGSLNVILASLVLLLTATTAHAQWEIEDSHTTASLRGIHNVGGGVAWASGTNGTVLRTTDEGKTWQTCPVPLAGTKDTAEKLDFRGIQAFDENTAIVMSSGPGGQSRLYKTTDSCQTWKLLFTNPDKDGFWDALQFSGKDLGLILGDPVSNGASGGFALFLTEDSGAHFRAMSLPGNLANPKTQGAFAASNSSLLVSWPYVYIGTGGAAGPKVYLDSLHQRPQIDDNALALKDENWFSTSWPVPMASGEAAGVFSLDMLFERERNAKLHQLSKPPIKRLIAVGGDYKTPDSAAGTAAFTRDGGKTWLPAQTPPHGYRSAVAYDAPTKTWITVGPNGTDISTDDGRNWRPLTPSSLDEKDADKNWNALSLPFVVGPHGRIGKLRPTALSPANPASAKAKP